MLIPSIDIVAGRAVQLIGGEDVAIEGGDPMAVLDRFSRVGEVAVVDIDAARGEGDNEALIAEMCRSAAIRVGGGIRDLDTAIRWLDRGASRIVIGTAASPRLLSQLPRERVVAAVDSRDGLVVTRGWRHETGDSLFDQVSALAPYCGGILATFVEREGRLSGTDLDRARDVIEAAGDAKVTIAGGISTAEQIADLDRIGADAQVGMAIYNGDLELAEAFAAPLLSDRHDGLWPTVVSDDSGRTLGLAYSSIESLQAALESGTGVYQSRSRGVWRKGETSGNKQELVRVAADCDRDALQFIVRQSGAGFCHTGSWTCWGEDRGISRLARRLQRIATDRPPRSNTVKLLDDPELLAAKLSEETAELNMAEGNSEVVHEIADLIYFALTRAAAAGVGVGEIETELAARESRVTRRPMERTDR